MDAKLIDLNEYIHSGEGYNGESFYHRTDPTVMLKLYFKNADISSVLNEHDLAEKVYRTGIPTPHPGEFVTDGNGRFGIRFERLADKISFSRAVGDNPERVEELARRFAGMCKDLHSIEVDASQFENIKDRYLAELEESPYFTDEERKRTEKFILSAPDAFTAIHGDLQYSNALMTPKGDYFIDLGSFAYGHPYFDLGQVLLSSNYSPDEFIREAFHMEPSTAREFWKFFVKGYFGEDASAEEYKELLNPYAGLMTLLIDRSSKSRNEIFHALLPR